MTQTPIAIIGLSGRYPGGAITPARLWENLKGGVDAIVESRGDRWDRGYLHSQPDRAGRFYTFEGGFLDSIDTFDAEFFGMSPREARQVDPQQRLLLELAWEAMEDAALIPKDLGGSRTGVFIGLSSHDYSDLVGPVTPDAYSNTGVSFSIASNRISYVFDFHGPSMTLDTACSSGMVSVHQACQSLAAGACDMALVGAANIMIAARPWMGFAKASMLSPAGRCKSFDADGAGYVRSEGGGMFVLKPLADAERDGNTILGVLVGTGVNSDGRTMGLSLPNGAAQAALMDQVYGEAGVKADDVFYFEAHGTGTSVGDPIECEAIARALAMNRTGDQPLHIGSIKSNIGHLEPAAGIAGLTKVLLAIKHREVPANLHFNTPNPKIEFEAWKLKVVDRPLPLPETDKPLMFGINSFGFGGTNAHAVLREYEGARTARLKAEALSSTPRAERPWSDMLLLSAQSPQALTAMAAQWATFLQGRSAAAWHDIRATAARCRTRHQHRLALHASTADEAAALLQQHADGTASKDIAIGRTATSGGHTRVAFVYSGNGPQWWRMGRELLEQEPRFRCVMEEVDGHFEALAGWSLVRELQRDELSSRMAFTEVAQPTLFALQVALTSLLRDAGIVPDAVFGHSVGEAAAAWASGALSLAQATQVIFHRSTTQATTAGMGRMAALGVSVAEAAEAIAEISGFLEIAAVNAPRAVTVAGDPAQLQLLCNRITEAGRFARMLTLDYPFHTRAMDGICADLLQRLDGLAPGATTVPFVSTVDGRVLDGSALGATYWWRNVREPVRFADSVDVMLKEQGISAFVEIGPHPVLRDYVSQCAKERAVPAVVLNTLRRPSAGKPSPEKEAVRATVLACHANGIGDAARLFAKPVRPAELPAYPWQRVRHWRGEVALPDLSPPTKRDHPLLGWKVGSAAGQWESLAETALLPYLLDHQVQDAVVFPAAGYIEMALAAAQLMLPAGTHDLEDFDILKPLVIAPEFTPAVQFSADPADGTWEIRSRLGIHAEGASTLHSRGRITRAEASLTPAPVDIASLMAAHTVGIDRESHYLESARRGLPYGPMFQGVRAVQLDAAGTDARSAMAEIIAPSAIAESLAAYRSHPGVLDACLQVLITLMAQSESRACAFIPVRIGRLRSFAALPARLFCKVVVTSDSARSGCADFTLWDEAGDCLMTLTDTRFQKVDFRASGPAPRVTERWRPDAASAAQAGDAVVLTSPSALAAQLQHSLQSLAAQQPPSLAPQFDALIGAYAAKALESVGARAGSFSLARLQRRAAIADERLPLLGALIRMAEADGLLVPNAAGWSWVADRAPADPAALWAALMQASPKHISELMLIAQAGERLPALLRGAEFAAPREGTGALLDPLLDSAPYRATLNRAAAAAVQQLVAGWPADRAIRVLELAAGSGALSAAVLPLLPALRCDYVFSDRDAAALDRATQRFSACRFMRCLQLDIDQPSEELAALAADFDLVLCADGLHATPSPVASLRRVRDLLAPGGMLMLIESQPQRLAELVFGQAAGWWRNGASPLATSADWLAHLAEADFIEPQALPDVTGASTPHHALLLAQKPIDTSRALPAEAAQKPASRHWLLLADASNAGATYARWVAAALKGRGQHVVTRTLARNDQEGASERYDSAAAMADVVALGTEEIVHLAGMASGAKDGAAMLALQDLRCLSTVSLIQAIKAAESSYKPRLQIVLHGAFNGPADAGPSNPMQAPVWGLGRVIANEHPDLAPKLIDQHGALDYHSAETLVDELLRSDAETEVLLMPHQRFVNRMQQTSLAELASEIASDKPSAGSAFRLESMAEGGLDGLSLRRIERTPPQAGQVEIAVRAAGLNFRDVLWAMGMLPEEAVEHGFSGATIGMECAGEVVAVGEGVSDLKVGDKVIGFATACFASHVTTSAGAVAKIPANLSFEEAATLPTAFLTALYALDHLAHLQAGERVLIHGAAGGVGLAAVQIAKLRGAIVFGTAGNEDKQRLLRLAGVDHVLNSRSLEFADRIMALTDGQGVDVVLNSLAGEAITKNLQILRPFGRLLEIGKRDFYANTRIGLRPFRNNLSYFGIDADTLLIERPDLARKVFLQMTQLFEDGLLRPLPYQALPIGRAAQAFRQMQQSRHVGKLVITVPEAQAVGEVQPPAINSATGIRGDATYLVTGGLGGFGLATARWLVSQGARHMALMSRRGATTDEARDGIAAMEAMGATVKAYAADVSQAGEVSRVLNDVRATMPPLRGVVHAAMVLDDGPILKLDGERLRRSFAPKSVGAWLLHEQTQADPIELFVMYSSGTTVVGNPGQGNYVAANIFLEALAQSRRAAGLPALSVGWGAIKDVGVLARNAGVEEMLQSRTGMGSVASADALAELGKLIAVGANRVSVAQFNLQRLGALLAGTRTPRFAPLATQSVIEALSEKRETLGERLLALPAAEHRDVVITCLRDHLGRILGTGAAQIDVERSLSDMGLDSLMAVELAESLERDVGRPVSVMQMIQAGSATAIADLLMAGMQAQPA